MLLSPASVVALFAALAVTAWGQSTPRQLAGVLAADLQTPQVTEMQLRQFAMKHVAPLHVPRNAAAWTTEFQRIRKHLLDDVIFHGWPKDWVNAPPRFEEVGQVESGQGYRTIKLRYEIVPNFYSSAILYEPEPMRGKVPAILNVNGHVGAPGKAIEYKQKRCINFAKRGIMALNLEWLDFGELTSPENRHTYGAYLDLAGANGVGLFYLAMRRGLDYLDQLPNVDRQRLGVTGLSGGGWQTITLSALDERVWAAVPVAGYASLVTDIEHPEYVGDDIEQNATDFRDGQDYAHLTAMRAPRPTLLIYNAEDDCCFRAGIVKKGVFDDIKPFYRLFDKEPVFSWHENADPGTHNYQLDNRLQAYRFFSEQFKLPVIENEIPVGAEIKSYKELEVGLPKDNLTILALARKLADEVSPSEGSGDAASQRTALKNVARFRPVQVKHAWAVARTKNKGVETRSFLFEFDNGICATGVWSKAIETPDGAPLTIVLKDEGKKSAANEVSESINRGDQVIALDLLFGGDDSLSARKVPEYTQLLSAIGERPLGMEAAQLLAIRGWLRANFGAAGARIDTTGVRSQTLSLVAVAVDPSAFTGVLVHHGLHSLRAVFDKPAQYEATPDLFCLDLYKLFDLPLLTSLSAPTRITEAE